MKKYILLLLLLPAFGFRNQSATEIIGNWKVVDIIIDPVSPMAQNQQLLAQAKLMMTQMVFSIKPDHQFVVTGGMNNRQMPPGTWQYNAATHILEVKPANDKTGKVGKILVSKNNKGEVFFKPTEGPVTLQVRK